MVVFRRWPSKFAAAALCLFALPAVCAEISAEAGRSFMASQDGTNTAFVEAVFDEHRLGDSRIGWAPDVSLGWIDGRDLPRNGDSRYGTEDRVLLLAGGARLRYGAADDWYRHLFFSFQLAAQDGRTRALSSAYEFVSTFGYTWHHMSLQVRHISNGGLHKPNWGETAVLVGFGFEL
jgi:hypothetical protein